MAPRWEVASGRVQICAALLDVDEKTGRARAIQRVFEVTDVPPA